MNEKLYLTWKCIGARILVVACQKFDGWKAYIDQVPGRNFDEEANDVARYGSGISEDLARFLFPQFANKPYGR
jgi:hypothetical protein